MKLGLGYLTLDCVDLELVTNFWEALLELEGRGGQDGFFQGAAWRLVFPTRMSGTARVRMP